MVKNLKRFGDENPITKHPFTELHYLQIEATISNENEEKFRKHRIFLTLV
jgi:hypothetical protein